MKIAHLQLLPLLSGVQQVSCQELLRLPKEEYVAEMICREAGALTETLAEDGIQSHSVEELQRAIHPVRDFKALMSLKALFKKEQYDVVHTHSSKTGFLGRVAAKWAGVSCIVHTVHGFAFPAANNRFEYLVYWLLEWIAGRCCDAVIVLTESDREICISSLGLSPDKVHLIPNGVDTSVYRPADADVRKDVRTRAFQAQEDEVVAVMVGRLWRQKAPECLVEAAIKVFESNKASKLKVYLVGDGELREGLEKRVEELQLGDKIHFMGWRADVPDLLKGADLFVLPSRWEGLSLAILEAMSCGVAVVASDIPGNRAALHDGKCGFLFPLEDVNALASAMEELTAKQETRNEWAQKGYNRVQDAHQLDERIDVLKELYCNILERK